MSFLHTFLFFIFHSSFFIILALFLCFLSFHISSFSHLPSSLSFIHLRHSPTSLSFSSSIHLPPTINSLSSSFFSIEHRVQILFDSALVLIRITQYSCRLSPTALDMRSEMCPISLRAVVTKDSFHPRPILPSFDSTLSLCQTLVVCPHSLQFVYPRTFRLSAYTFVYLLITVYSAVPYSSSSPIQFIQFQFSPHQRQSSKHTHTHTITIHQSPPRLLLLLLFIPPPPAATVTGHLVPPLPPNLLASSVRTPSGGTDGNFLLSRE